jgi:hypothetical protein
MSKDKKKYYVGATSFEKLRKSNQCAIGLGNATEFAKNLFDGSAPVRIFSSSGKTLFTYSGNDLITSASPVAETPTVDTENRGAVEPFVDTSFESLIPIDETFSKSVNGTATAEAAAHEAPHDLCSGCASCHCESLRSHGSVLDGIGIDLIGGHHKKAKFKDVPVGFVFGVKKKKSAIYLKVSKNKALRYTEKRVSTVKFSGKDNVHGLDAKLSATF